MPQSLSIAMYSPYLPKHFGGGERYFLSVAEYLARTDMVTVFIDATDELETEKIREEYETFLNLDLSRITFQKNPMKQMNPIQRILWTRQFDVMYYLTDGSLFFTKAKKNILHIQIPFSTPKRGLLNFLKLRKWNVKNANSAFTKNVIERTWRTKVPFIHYPFVDTQLYKSSARKEKIILNVGRFFTQLHAKRQDILVKAFIKLIEQGKKDVSGWRLVLIGKVENEAFAKKVAELAKGYPVDIIHDADDAMLRSYYAKSKIYWHAAGYEVDEYLEPERVEHFGISTIEAMASGCVPIVHNKGGQKEIIEHGIDGFLWNEIQGCVDKTLACIRDEVDMKEIAEHAVERAHFFTRQKFYATIDKMIGKPVDETQVLTSAVSVVIPNFNGKKLLKKHLPAVIAMVKEGDEIVIVDDASTDDSVDWLVQTFQLREDKDRGVFMDRLYQGKITDKKVTIKLIANNENQRFAYSVNRGVENAEHDLVFVLNSDVSPKKDALDQLLPYFIPQLRADDQWYPDRVFSVGCNEIEQDMGTEIHGGKNELWFERGLFTHSRASDFSTGSTAWASGGSALFNRRKWEELDGFDLSFRPAYWEDIDLSYRAKEQGWNVWFEANALVDHNHETTNRTEFGQQQMERMSMKNGIRFTWKHSTMVQRVLFIIWLPYHLTVTNSRSNWMFGKALWDWCTDKK